jgi:GntR family transcriptional regulator
MINKNIPIPIYYQLMQLIRGSIETGQLKPADSIPTEIEMMKQYGISRATVRQALMHLVNEGYIRRIKAKGTFVNEPPARSRFIGTLKGFSEEMRQKGLPHSTKVMEKSVLPAPALVAEKLQIASGGQVFYLKRLRFVQGDPVLIAESYLPASICEGIEKEDFEDSSLYDVLESGYGLVLHHGRREFEPVMPGSKEEAQLLGITMRTPILYVESVVYTESDTPVEYVEIKIRGRFAVDLMQA